jgi:hypothetical protein
VPDARPHHRPLIVHCVWAAAFLFAVLVSAPDAAVVTVLNRDLPGEGLNDPTPVAPIGGNGGTTLGAQRLLALQAAADLWAAQLDSRVDIRIAAQFDPLPCAETQAVLGRAAPPAMHRDFPGAPLAGTWYAPALANKFAGVDLNPAVDDIEAQFNAVLGTTCVFPRGWYYGLDGNAAATQTDFVTVAMHELGHGLGFFSVVDLSTGALLLGADDVYSRNVEDHRSGRRFSEMTNAERVAASTGAPSLHWVGRATLIEAAVLSAGRDPSGHVELYAPAPAEPGSSVSHFARTLIPDQLMEPKYTGPNHDVGLARAVLRDLGWKCGDGVLDTGEECDDGNGVGDDCCTASCTLAPGGSACEDGDGCTVGDVCDSSGQCITGPPRVCDDGNRCTEEACLTGFCQYEHQPSYAGVFCELDALAAGVCAPSDPTSPGLQATIVRRIAKVRAQVERAMHSLSTREHDTQLRRAARRVIRLTAAVRRAARRGAVSRSCRGTLQSRLDLARQTIRDVD